MLGGENDFADYYILLLIIALTRFLFNHNETRFLKYFHLFSTAVVSVVIVFTFRRYLWIELIMTYTIIGYNHLRTNKYNINSTILNLSLALSVLFCTTLYVGPDKITQNNYVGRLLTSLPIISSDFESEYGTVTAHDDEIKEGWYNVKKHFFLGISPFGFGMMERKDTKYQGAAMYVHNGYLYIWLQYGLVGFCLLLIFYYNTLKLGYINFFKYRNSLGLMLITFICCQLVKNIVWTTIIANVGLTIIYIFLFQ
jgi:hypothetical protein